MIFVQGHKGGMDAAALAVASQHIAQQSRDAVACALMSAHKGCPVLHRRGRSVRWPCAHKAAQCIAEAARAVASQHEAQQSLREVSPQFEFRYQ